MGLRAGIEFDLVLTISGVEYGCMLQTPRGFQKRDVNEWKASVATGPPTYSDSDVYSVDWQEDWRHGFGFPHKSEEFGYAYSGDHVDTRRQGVVQLATALRSADASGKRVLRYLDYTISAGNASLAACGDTGGVRYTIDGAAFTANTDPDDDGANETARDLLDAGNYLFMSLQGSSQVMAKLRTGNDPKATALDTGTASGGSASTLVDDANGKTWDTNEYRYHGVYIHTGTGNGQWRTISSNTSDTLTITPDWDTNPDNTSQYRIGGWSPAGNLSNPPDNFEWLAKGGGYLWASQRTTNYLHVSAEADGSDWEGHGETDAGVIIVGAEDTNITSLCWWNNNMYVGKEDGLYMIGSNDAARKVYDSTGRESAYNFKYMTVGPDGALYFTVLDRVYRWVGRTPIDITPGNWGVLHTGRYWTGPWRRRGRGDGYASGTQPPYVGYRLFHSMARVGSDIVVVGRTTDTSYAEHVLYWTGSGWHKLYQPITAGTYEIYAIGQSWNTNRTYISVGGTSTTTYAIKMRAGGDLPEDDYPTSGNHYVYFSRISLGLLDVPKYLKALKLRSFNLNTTQTIAWAYQIDDNDSWYTLGTQNTSPYQAIDFASTATCKTVQKRANLLTGTFSNTPYLDAYALKLLARPTTVWGYSITLQVGDEVPDRNGKTGYKPTGRELLAALEAARDATAPITLDTPLESDVTVFVTALAEPQLEYDEKDQPYLICQMSLVEA